uniref:Uncharacterized protein n=1 Tax=viral metagenome TaxID=1070528 RepID=A0A6M3IYD1_9ZZZZ
MTDKLTIITNGHPRDIIGGWELTEEEREEVDYYETKEELEDASFFRYKGNTYDIGEFSRISKGTFPPFWDGYISDSFFSGILIRYPTEEWGGMDTDHVIVGWYYC